MKIGFQITFFVLLLNLIAGLMYASSVPGTDFSNILTGTGNTTQYEERYNASEFMERTEPEASTAFTFVGHIWGGLQLVWNAIRFTLLGFPTMLQMIGDQIQDATAKRTYGYITDVIYVAVGFIYFMWLYQLLTGRRVED